MSNDANTETASDDTQRCPYCWQWVPRYRMYCPHCRCELHLVPLRFRQAEKRDYVLAGLTATSALLFTTPAIIAMTLQLSQSWRGHEQTMVLIGMWNTWVLGIPLGRVAILYIQSVKGHLHDLSFLWREYWSTQLAVLTPLFALLGVFVAAAVVKMLTSF